jgi:hypothetical protein
MLATWMREVTVQAILRLVSPEKIMHGAFIVGKETSGAGGGENGSKIHAYA